MKKKNIDIFGAIADPNRRRILMLLSTGALTISALASEFDISRPAISKHVKILAENRLVMITDIGRERHCDLQPDGLKEVYEWIKSYESFWTEKLDNLEKLLNSKRKNKKIKK